MKLLLSLVSAVILVASCARADASVSDTVAAATGAATGVDAGAPRPYPFWTGDDEAPAGAAFPIAPGYFLVSIYAMGVAAVDMGADPHVVIRDGNRAYQGEFVDVSNGDRIGLIRSEFRPPCYRLSASEVGAVIAGIDSAGDKRQAYQPALQKADACSSVPVTDEEGTVRFTVFACQTERPFALTGMAYVDGGTGIIALLGPAGGGATHDGVGAERIRHFLDKYFSSWGRAVRPKPAY